MALQEVSWMAREEGVFDSIASTMEDFNQIPSDCAPGSICYIVSENIYVVKRSDGTWIGIPEGVLFPPELVEPLPLNYLMTRRWEIMMANQIEKWRKKYETA